MFFLNFLLICVICVFQITNSIAHEVKVNGNKSIEANTIKLYAGISDGKISQQDISNAIKKIYKTGFFNDVKITHNNINLSDETIIINVSETPIIKKIAFNGRKSIPKDKILEEISTKEKAFLSKSGILNDTKRLTMIYQKIGFLNVKIKPMVELLENGTQAIVIFDINEGNKSQIAKIEIEGNARFSDSTIKEILQTKERTILKLNLGATFDNESVQNQQEAIKRFYLTQGYPEFKNLGVVSALNYKKNLFNVKYFIFEGEKHRFGNYEIKNFVEDISVDNISKKEMTTTKGEFFNIENIEKTVANLQQFLQKNGFILAKVEYTTVLTPEKTVNIEYTIRNSRRVYLNEIAIIGNSKTSDNIIRREILLKEGDVYDISKLQRSLQRIRNLQYFDDVQIDEKISDSNPDRINIAITVKERSTASINASVGADQFNGISGNIGINESNFLGEGYTAGISVDRSMYGQNYSLSFTEPYFKGKDILFGTQFSYSQYGNPNFSSYQSLTQSSSFFMGYSVTQYLRHNITYKYQDSGISQLSSTSSPYILAQIGNFQTSSISHTLSYDRRDNNFIPNSGHSFTIRQELAGFGGNMKFISSEVRADWYKQIFGVESLVFGIKGRLATIQGIGNSAVNVQNLYSLGGGFGMRGFNYRGIGPRYQYLNGTYESFSYGGENLGLISTEIRFPNGISKDLGINTYLFYDVGTLYGIDTSKIATASGGQMYDNKNLRMSVGLGLSWRSPMGPIGFAIGKTIQAEVYDSQLSFLITFGNMGQ